MVEKQSIWLVWTNKIKHTWKRSFLFLLVCVCMPIGINFARASGSLPLGALVCQIETNGETNADVRTFLKNLDTQQRISAISDEAGYIYFEGLPSGRYEIRAYAPKHLMPVSERGYYACYGRDNGFDSYLVIPEIVLEPGDRLNSILHFAPITYVEGYIKDGALQVVYLERMDMQGNYHPYKHTLSDAQGYYQFVEIEAGNYRLLVQTPDGKKMVWNASSASGNACSFQMDQQSLQIDGNVITEGS